MEQKNQGEGNRDADRRYREGVRKTLENTTEAERAREARDLPDDEREPALEAEEAAKAKKRPSSGSREI